MSRERSVHGLRRRGPHRDRRGERRISQGWSPASHKVQVGSKYNQSRTGSQRDVARGHAGNNILTSKAFDDRLSANADPPMPRAAQLDLSTPLVNKYLDLRRE